MQLSVTCNDVARANDRCDGLDVLGLALPSPHFGPNDASLKLTFFLPHLAALDGPTGKIGTLSSHSKPAGASE